MSKIQEEKNKLVYLKERLEFQEQVDFLTEKLIKTFSIKQLVQLKLYYFENEYDDVLKKLLTLLFGREFPSTVFLKSTDMAIDEKMKAAAISRGEFPVIPEEPTFTR